MRSNERIAAWRALQWATTLIMGRFGSDLAQHDLNIEEFDVLAHIAWSPNGALPLRELAGSMVVGYRLSRSGLTRILDRMEHAGLVIRTLSSEDRRQFNLALTERGRKLFDAVWPRHVEGIEKYFSRPLTDTDIRSLMKVLAKLIKANEAAEGQ